MFNNNYLPMFAKYIDHMGNDLSVVNAARVSFDKKSSFKDTELKTLQEKDVKLISYLAKHNHWTPFGHTSVTFHFRAPLFVARQLGKHQIGLVWNEVSRRYVSDIPSFFEPTTWREKADNVKQGSADTVVHGLDKEYDAFIAQATDMYSRLLEAGVCAEQARMVLPQSMNTEWYWTGSIAAWARIWKLRAEKATQKETQDVVRLIDGPLNILFPVSWNALTTESK